MILRRNVTSSESIQASSKRPLACAGLQARAAVVSSLFVYSTELFQPAPRTDVIQSYVGTTSSLLSRMRVGLNGIPVASVDIKFDQGD
jgi:hypothetical protein